MTTPTNPTVSNTGWSAPMRWPLPPNRCGTHRNRRWNLGLDGADQLDPQIGGAVSFDVGFWSRGIVTDYSPRCVSRTQSRGR